MITKKLFNLGTPKKTYQTAARAVERAEALLAQVHPSNFPDAFATVIPTPIGDRFHPVIIFQGNDSVQAAINCAREFNFVCYA